MLKINWKQLFGIHRQSLLNNFSSILNTYVQISFKIKWDIYLLKKKLKTSYNFLAFKHSRYLTQSNYKCCALCSPLR